MCLECMQYHAEDRIDTADLEEWLHELVLQTEKSSDNGK